VRVGLVRTSSKRFATAATATATAATAAAAAAAAAADAAAAAADAADAMDTPHPKLAAVPASQHASGRRGCLRKIIPSTVIGSNTGCSTCSHSASARRRAQRQRRDAPAVPRDVAAQVKIESKLESSSSYSLLQALSSGRFHREFDGVNLHRSTARMSSHATRPAPSHDQGLALVHFSVQRKRFLWDRGCM